MLRASRELFVREWPLFVVTVLALVLRAWNLDFSGGIPRARPDEELFVVAALKMFSGDTDPHYAVNGWPELFFRIVFAAQAVYRWLASLGGGPETNLGCLYAIDPIALTRLGRIVSCVAGTATVPVTAMLARRIVPATWSPASRRSAGLLAATFIACSYLHARDSHFGVSDATVVLFCTTGLWMVTAAVDAGRTRSWILAGVFLGLAVSTKWSALGALPPCVIAVVWRLVAVRGERLQTLGGALGAIVAGTAAFLFGSPHFFDAPEAYWNGIFMAQQQRHADVSGWGYDPTATVANGLEHHFLVTLPLGLGWPVFALALVGLVFALISRRGPMAIVALFCVVFHVAILGPTTLVILRYAMPLLPALAALAAIVVAWLVDRFVAARRSRVLATWTAPVVGVLLVLAPLRDLAGFLRVSGAPDTRERASAWLMARSSRDDDVVVRGGFAATHVIQRGMADACSDALPPASRRRVLSQRGDDSDFERLVRRGAKAWGRTADRVIRFSQGKPAEAAEWLVLARPLLACGSPGRAEGWTEPSATCFVVRATFSPGEPSCDAYYDSLDSFYVPAQGLDGIQSIGPEVRIYENVCRTHRPR